MMVRTTVLAAVVSSLIAAATVSGVSAQSAPGLRLLGLSPITPPADSLLFRQALAHAVDRETIVKSIVRAGSGSDPALIRQVAMSIQHPRLPGYNPAIRGHPYDPSKAKSLLGASGWTSGITIFAGPASGTVLNAFYDALTEGMTRALGTPVYIQRVSNFNALVKSTRGGAAAVYTYAWESDPQDFGYPSFALGLGEYFISVDADIKTLVEKRDVAALEQALLDRVFIIPVFNY